MTVPPPPNRPLVDVYNAAYAGVPNWDIGRPQRAFIGFERAGLVQSPVLDVGCGTGELALYLARQGHDVLGIDLSELAVIKAREKAQWRRILAHFLHMDALDVAGLQQVGLLFRTVVDSGMFHVLGAAERDRFVGALGTIVRPGGLYAIIGDARHHPGDVYGITPVEVERRFRAAGGWEIVLTQETVFERRWGRNSAYFLIIRRT